VRDDYWRRENYETLLRVADAAAERGLAGYADDCRLRERGLRAEAFAVLRGFIAGAVEWPLERRAEVTDWLLGLELHHSQAFDLVPHPLRAGLVGSGASW